ncbi:MAG: histidine kinase [Clostridiales bacterium]|nr:histidine kinase [Clostridiales bacterium]
MQHRSFSLKYRLLLYVFVLLLPLVLLLGAVGLLQIDGTRRQLEESEQTNLQLVVSLLEQEMMEIENYLFDTVQNNRAFRALADIKDGTDFVTGSKEVFQSVDRLFHNYDSLTFVALYHTGEELYASADNGLSYLEIPERIALRRAIERRMDRHFYVNFMVDSGWFDLEATGRNFLCRIVRNQDVCCAGIIDLQQLVIRLENSYDMEKALAFRDGNTLLTPLELSTHISEWNDHIFDFRAEDNQQYAVVSKPIHGITLSYIWLYSGLSGVMGWSPILMVIIAAVMVAALPLLYRSLRKSFFEPLDGLVVTMERISAGELEITADTQYEAKEFGMINQTFNEMLGQIRHLRIEQYERELETRQAKLQFLQAQIRPHFYLNCLKTLYSLAKQRQYANIEQGILLVSNHLRYAFQQREDTVPLREELRYCDNYLKLWEIMTENKPELHLKVDTPAFDIAVPPVSLLTFVENSIRCALVPNQILRITITAHILKSDEGDILCLTVQDNGVGFTQEQLIKLNSNHWDQAPGDHVGIQNVVRRFRILYGQDFTIAFSNRGGAVQELYLPVKTDKGGMSDEAADC